MSTTTLPRYYNRMHMGKEQLGTLVGTLVLYFCCCWSLLQRPRQASLYPHYNPQENNSSILTLLLIESTHVRWHDHPKIHFAFGVWLWTWSTTMLIKITWNSNIFLTLGLKNLQNYLHEISLVKGFSILPKSLPYFF